MPSISSVDGSGVTAAGLTPPDGIDEEDELLIRTAWNVALEIEEKSTSPALEASPGPGGMNCKFPKAVTPNGPIDVVSE